MRDGSRRSGQVAANGLLGTGATFVMVRYHVRMSIVRIMNAWQPPAGLAYKCPLCKGWINIPFASTKSETLFKDLRQISGVKPRLELRLGS